ncbi:MAG: ABC transporter permease [Thermoanaerobaculia bacterium]|nr:ABC transporter permease [Thermoanaerobaculia bacterium]
MTRFLLRRLGASALLLVLAVSATFFLLRAAPGDPTARLDDPRIPPQYQQDMRARYGLDQPLLVQYADWIADVARGDWGVSFTHRRPVLQVLTERIPATLLLTATALLLQFLLGAGLGVVAAQRPGSWRDALVRLAAMTLYSLPLFFLALVGVEVIADLVPGLPSGHMRSVDHVAMGPWARAVDLARHLFLPALTLGLATAGAILRFTRNSLLDVLSEDYIRTARAKGLGESRVVWLHGMKNAAIPLVQILGLSLPFLLSGSLVVEVVFSWPGMGRLTYEAVRAYDYPLVLAATALAGVLVVLGNLVADLLHAALDPRVREAFDAS